MSKYQKEFDSLNPEQKKAVETMEGPVLVIAGPGTGKTQLLAMRVANILRKTDAGPGNILCLTFTDNASRNMRERLSSIIGQSAYHVGIHTFHSFGTDIINNYPDYFTRRQLLQQIDELGRYELLRDIFEHLPHSNPLSVKVGSQFVHLKATLNVVSWLKQNALLPSELVKIINSNQKFIEAVSKELAQAFAVSPSAKQLRVYENFLADAKKHVTGKNYFGFPEYGAECTSELEEAIESTDGNGTYAKPITSWRNKWCKKDSDGIYVFKDGGQNYRKISAIAEIYQKMIDKMSTQGLYDFDDMVIEAVHAMESNDELRYNLQERYQYVLVDEFQDTNKAQLRMLMALGDNPVHEKRPNIMAVGDDDQAIYAFQGAEVSNMSAFFKSYDKPALISLRDNYRSNAIILEAASQVAEQITNRLKSLLPEKDKILTSKKQYETSVANHMSFTSELAQYDWIAGQINTLIKNGTSPEEIAVIAPRHRYLERLMPYLGSMHIPVAYERRENILEAPIVRQLLTMSELVVAIAQNRQDDIDTLISQVLSYDFLEITNEELIDISLECYNKHKHWLDVLHSHKNTKLKTITNWFIGLSKRSKLEPMEYMLDQLIGTELGSVDSQYDDFLLPKPKSEKFISPMRSYYFDAVRYENSTDTYLTLLGQLSTLRQRLRLWKPNQTLYINDLLEFSKLHVSANLKIVDTNPHTQMTNAVQVMTAYKAKGLEFQAVFLINAQDEVWGPTARSHSRTISLPKNLPIEPTGDEDNDKLRLLFVALTRAKHTLYVTSYGRTLENKLSPGLSYIMGEGKDVEKPIHNVFKSKSIDKPATAKEVEILSTDWAYRFRQVIADKKTLFEPILANYKLSVTHLNNFLDVKDGGPEYFFIHNLLRFPEAISPSAAYGDSIHKTLQWLHAHLRESGKLPAPKMTQKYFIDMLGRKHLMKSDYKRLDKRGREALERYISFRGKELSANDIVERGFNNEGVVINGAQLSGKIDKMHFTGSGDMQVIDFKTGKPAKSWQGKDEFEKIKLYKYRQQLFFYKLLVENSASFSKKLTVKSGALEFIEPDENGKLVNNLELSIKPEELADFSKLVGAVWSRIMNLDFPDTSKYPKTLAGIKQFEEDLLSENI